MKKVVIWQIVGFCFSALGGTLLHFLYQWLNKSKWIAPFSGINESTWEHMKLLFWPLFIFAIIQSFFFLDRTDYWCIKQSGIFLGLLLIPTIFYTYNGAVGKSPDWVNIAIFFISAAAAFIYEARKLKSDIPICNSRVLPIALLSILALTFTVFTFNPPQIGIFKPPQIQSGV